MELDLWRDVAQFYQQKCGIYADLLIEVMEWTCKIILPQ
ncbi:MAG: hypothetical protein CM1200mP38_6730 [Dehalococcoidia bacterium]|nr:MAG: hypothetical protein CM1200mP38_6730 [Dehalococcoidia bacterium]